MSGGGTVAPGGPGARWGVPPSLSHPSTSVEFVKKVEREKRIQELYEFRAALGELLAVSDGEERSYSGPPTIVPRPGLYSEWAAARAKVDLLAARAAHTLQAVGVGMSYKPPGTMQTVPVNPAAAWATMLGDRPMFSPIDMDACLNQAIGALEANLGSSSEPAREPMPGARHVPTIVVGIIIGAGSTVGGGLILWWLGVGR